MTYRHIDKTSFDEGITRRRKKRQTEIKVDANGGKRLE
jgi:hypothetical protein